MEYDYPVLILKSLPDGKKSFNSIDRKVWNVTTPCNSVIIVLAIFNDGSKHLMKYSDSVPEDCVSIYIGFQKTRTPEIFYTPEEEFFNTPEEFNKRYETLKITWDDLQEVIKSDNPNGKDIPS